MKLPVVSGVETIKALYRAGFKVVRQKGSYVRLEKKSRERDDQGYRSIASDSEKGNFENNTKTSWVE